jgi:hypothetical protein
MHEFRLKLLIEAMDVLVNCSGMIHSHHPRLHPRVGTRTRKDIERYLEELIPQLTQADLDMCLRGAARLLNTVKETDQSAIIVSGIDALRTRLLDQADSIFCLMLTTRERELFEQPAPFGEEVEAKFQTTSEDLSEAAKCLALQRFTAAIFHLMRALEVAAHAVAGKIGATVIDEHGKRLPWGVIANNMKIVIDRMQKGSDHQIKWYRVQNQLEVVNRAWRVPTAHPKQTYTPDEAYRVFDATKGFMQELSPLV